MSVQLFADVSQYSGDVDFTAYRAAGHDILGYKVSEGRTFLDPQAIRNRDQCLATGTRGLAYHFLYGGPEYYSDATLWGKQCEFFLGYAPDSHAHCVDVEMLAPTGQHLGVREWVNAYRVHFASHPLLVYSNQGLWVNRSKVPYNGPVGTLLWHAGYRDGLYTSATGSLEQQWGAALGGKINSMAGLGYSSGPAIWQFTDHAKVPGIGALCDGNAFVGSLADWDSQLVHGAVTDDMPTLDEIKRAVWATQYQEYVDENGNGQRDPRSVADFLISAHSHAVHADRNVADLAAQVATLAEAVARIEAQTKPSG